MPRLTTFILASGQLASLKFIAAAKDLKDMKFRQVPFFLDWRNKLGEKIRLVVGIILVILTMSFMMTLNSFNMAVAQDQDYQKLCSGFVDGNYRDSISVPFTWKIPACQRYAESIGADYYQLGCLSPNGFSWGEPNGGPPGRNRCEWSY
ncbi:MULTISPECIES: hypothetical protein [Trichocoleus]|uniref:Uncharacterized protein n=1 Tax=Trichocoleus desertorum GB2-A4 TaxID=2933944 RepID=A0ABV0J979_9CYAN|nr:hypothetical protein [Trichocoleus sp. FACHB-46]MBD1864716.1 hypothetical protein [Trichocoleus sp. FACHB-46]